MIVVSIPRTEKPTISQVSARKTETHIDLSGFSDFLLSREGPYVPRFSVVWPFGYLAGQLSGDRSSRQSAISGRPPRGRRRGAAAAEGPPPNFFLTILRFILDPIQTKHKRTKKKKVLIC